MTACPSCGAEAPEGARFCPSCGASLAPSPPMATERKVVTTLFADIVGFTALSERFDPEDVDAALRGYFEMARATIERFGGVVEKYIGDAVAGVFGAPAAHEDDAERAVRAALEIVDGMEHLRSLGEEKLRVRVGVNTGRSLVRLGAVPASGEGIQVGDAVNTAARLLAAAPPMGVVVGRSTRRLTARAISYEQMDPCWAKGKQKPIERWLARGAVARRGIDAIRREQSKMVGREVELGMLRGLLERVAASDSPHHALVIGEAGIGKSRLLREFFDAVDSQPGFFCTWRQGRCPAYGDGLAYWPIREIVSAHAGILQGDDPAVVEAKLADSLSGDGLDEWMISRLRPLVGLPSVQTERDENFAAWTKFLESIARKQPTVIVFEDLHWASEPTLAFIDYFARHACAVPLLLIGTARPEFLEAHADGTGFSEDAMQIQLKALTGPESARLVAHIQADAVVPGLEELVFSRCGGNPLYTEEFVRYVAERAVGERGNDQAHETGAATDAPDSLLALIAARIDALRPDQKEVLANASIVGQVFWPGALSAVEGSIDVDGPLADLEERGFIRRHTDSTLGSEQEFAFWHALIRDVAYEQLPRASRAVKHARIAQWIEAFWDAGGSELAQVSAYHFRTAHDLATATRDPDLAAALREPTMNALKRAGDAMLAVDVEVAGRNYGEAYGLAEPGDALRPHLRAAMAEASLQRGRLAESVKLYEDAVAELRVAGERRAAALAMSRLSSALYWLEMGGADGAAQRWRAEALELLEADGPSAELVTVLEERAVQCARDLDCEEAVRFADQAIEMSRALEMPEPVRSLAYRGVALCDAGIDSGLGDLRRAWQLALDRGNGLEADMACQILADATYPHEGPDAGFAIAQRGLEYSRKRGEHLTSVWFRLQMVQFDRLGGRWREALDAALELERILEARDATVPLHDLRFDLTQIRLHQGDLSETQRLLEWCEDHSAAHPFTRLGDLSIRAVLCGARGDGNGARDALVEIEVLSRGRRRCAPVAMALPQLARTAVGVGATESIERILSDVAPPGALATCASLTFAGLIEERAGRAANAQRSLADAATAWRAFGDPWELALALRDRGRCLLALGRVAEGAASLAEARTILTRLDARPALAETDDLLRGHRADA